eukprot:119335_1
MYGAYLDDDDDDSVDSGDDNGDFTCFFEKQFNEAVLAASGMPESMYKESNKYFNEQMGEGGGGGGGEGEGSSNFIGPQLPGQGGDYGAGAVMKYEATDITEVNMHGNDEKDGKEEKGPPAAAADDDIDDIDVDMIDDDDKDDKLADAPPVTHRQTSIKFHELIKNVTLKYAESLISSLDFQRLLRQLLNILKVASSDRQATAQRDLVVRYAVRLWVSILLYKPALLLDLFDFLRKDPTFILAAIQSPDTELGSEFAKSIRKLCRYVDESPNYKNDKDLQQKLP